MNELQRMEYMAALGVDTYVPRWVLPGAAASVQANLPLAAAVDTASAAPNGEPLPKKPNAAAVSASGSTAILADLVAKTAVKTLEAAPVLGQPTAASDNNNGRHAAADVRFTLNIWRVNSSLLVVDSHIPKAALPTASLLVNMLRAKHIVQALPGADSLQWPMFEHNSRWGGLAEAREMVSAFLTSRLEPQPVKYLWLMGRDAFDAVAPESNEYNACLGTALGMDALACTALVMPSLADMLSAPKLKASAWQAISAFNVSD